MASQSWLNVCLWRTGMCQEQCQNRSWAAGEAGWGPGQMLTYHGEALRGILKLSMAMGLAY